MSTQGVTSKKMGWSLLLSVLLVAGLTLLQAQLWTGTSSIFAIHHLDRQIAKVTQHNQQLAQRNQQLYAQVQQLKQKPTAIEALARDELGMIKKGEVFYNPVETVSSSQQTITGGQQE